MNNLKGIDVDFPLNIMTVVTGVSGSGKSSLVKGILYPALKRHLGEVFDAPGEYMGLEGDYSAVKHVEFIDQNPIGKSTRSNAATYLKAYDEIRRVFADQQMAKQLGMTAGHGYALKGGWRRGRGVFVISFESSLDFRRHRSAKHFICTVSCQEYLCCIVSASIARKTTYKIRIMPYTPALLTMPEKTMEIDVGAVA